MSRSFAVRGVVEGFYGTPWTHDARLDVIAFLAERGMNAYAYAPKDDAKHRAEWRVPYVGDELSRFEQLATHCRERAVRFGFAISPGLDITYDDETDRSVLLAKLTPLRDSGVDWFLFLVDDIPMQPGLAARQADLATWLAAQLGDAALTVCPTEYVGTRPSPYLTDLGNAMPPAVDIMWTGPTVCSPELRADDARSWAKATGDRRVIVWDNYPVNDALMVKSLHLGPYEGRDPELVDVVGGVLCNPMTQAYASKVALATAMEFFADPDGYDPRRSWARAIADVGGSRAASLGVLARACADSPIALPATLDLHRGVAALPAGHDELVAELKAARALPTTFARSDDDPLAQEVAPWADSARLEADAGLAALKLISKVAAAARATGATESGEAEALMHQAFAVLFLWSGARADGNVVFGPRFALYTPVIQLADGSPGLDAGAAVREDDNAIDALCRLALRTYDEWRIRASAPPKDSA